MAKIRPLHPDIWTDEDFIGLSSWARLLFMGLWNHACDNGHLEDRSNTIKLRILPADDVNAADLLREIDAAGLIHRADGWVTIPGAATRWRVDKRYFKGCKMPGCGKLERETPRGNTEPTPSTRRDHSTDGDGDSDGDGELTTAAAAAALPPSVEILRGRLEAHKLQVRWDLATPDDLAEIEALIALHGDGPLVKSALAQYVPDRPARFVSAWMNGWRSLAAPGTSLRLVDTDPCTKPGHNGTTTHCTECASERLEKGANA